MTRRPSRATAPVPQGRSIVDLASSAVSACPADRGDHARQEPQEGSVSDLVPDHAPLRSACTRVAARPHHRQPPALEDILQHARQP